MRRTAVACALRPGRGHFGERAPRRHLVRNGCRHGEEHRGEVLLGLDRALLAASGVPSAPATTPTRTSAEGRDRDHFECGLAIRGGRVCFAVAHMMGQHWDQIVLDELPVQGLLALRKLRR